MAEKKRKGKKKTVTLIQGEKNLIQNLITTLLQNAWLAKHTVFIRPEARRISRTLRHFTVVLVFSF